MSDINGIVQAGKELGLAGEELKNWVKEQQDFERNIRAEERNKDRERRELEEAKLKAAAEEQKTLRELEEKKLAWEKEKWLAEKMSEKEKLQLTEHIEMQKLKVEREKLEQDKQKLEQDKNLIEKPVLPPFSEEKDKFDNYISRFENYAKIRKWKRENWSMQLSMLLTGDTLDVFYGLTEPQQQDYDKVKEALMQRFSLTEEGFRKELFGTKVEGEEAPAQFMGRLERLFTKWVDAARVQKTYEGLKQLILKEEFYKRCHVDGVIFA